MKFAEDPIIFMHFDLTVHLSDVRCKNVPMVSDPDEYVRDI